MVGSAICRVVISKQNERRNTRNSSIHSRDHGYYSDCTLEASKYQILEIDATHLFTVFYFNRPVHQRIWWIREHWIEMDSFLLGNPLPHTVYNHWSPNMEWHCLKRQMRPCEPYFPNNLKRIAIFLHVAFCIRLCSFCL